MKVSLFTTMGLFPIFLSRLDLLSVFCKKVHEQNFIIPILAYEFIQENWIFFFITVNEFIIHTIYSNTVFLWACIYRSQMLLLALEQIGAQLGFYFLGPSTDLVTIQQSLQVWEIAQFPYIS